VDLAVAAAAGAYSDVRCSSLAEGHRRPKGRVFSSLLLNPYFFPAPSRYCLEGSQHNSLRVIRGSGPCQSTPTTWNALKWPDACHGAIAHRLLVSGRGCRRLIRSFQSIFNTFCTKQLASTSRYFVTPVQTRARPICLECLSPDFSVAATIIQLCGHLGPNPPRCRASFHASLTAPNVPGMRALHNPDTLTYRYSAPGAAGNPIASVI